MSDFKSQALDLDHVRHEVSTALSIVKSVKPLKNSDPELAEQLIQDCIARLTKLLNEMDAEGTSPGLI